MEVCLTGITEKRIPGYETLKWVNFYCFEVECGMCVCIPLERMFSRKPVLCYSEFRAYFSIIVIVNTQSFDVNENQVYDNDISGNEAKIVSGISEQRISSTISAVLIYALAIHKNESALC